MASLDTKDPLGLESAYRNKVSSSGNDPLGLEAELLKKKGHSTYALPTGAGYSENGGQSDQNSQNTDNPTGFRQVDISKLKPTLPAHNNTIDLTNSEAEIEKQQKAQKDAQAQYEKDHPDTGTWSNALPTLFHATLGIVTKGAAGIGNIARDLSGLAEPSNDTNVTSSAKALYKEDPWGENAGELTDYGKQVEAGKTKDALGKMIIGLDAYNNETAKSDYENHLPKTFLGNTATGLINIAPIAATAALFPEAELAEGGAAAETSVNLAALQKLKTIAYNPFTKVSAIQGGLIAYDEAKQKGETPGQAVIEGTEGLLKEGGQAAVYNILGEFGANYLSPKLAKSLTESGIIKNGKLTRMGTDAASDAIIFGAYPIASNLIQGKPVDWDEVEQGIGTGFAFGIPKAMHVYGDYSEADSQFKQTGDAVAMKNFYDAAPEAIQQAYKLTDNVIDLNAKAVDYAAKAKAETDLGKRKELIAASSMYQKLADVKTVTQSVLGDPTEFINNINASTDLTDEQKSGLINKIKKVPSIISGVAKPDPINNFADATPEDMVNAMQRPETADELQSMAYEKALAAQNATDPELQASLNAEHQELQKHSDIKTIGNTVIEHGFNNFHDAVNNSDLPDDLKSTLISKAHGITQEFNPVVKEQAETQQTVTDLTSKIDDLQNTPGATDPITNPAGVNELIDLVEKRTDAQVDLLDKVADNPEQIPGVAEGEKIADELNLPADEISKKENKAAPQEADSSGALDGGFRLKTKDFGNVTVVPREDGDFDLHPDEGGVLRATKEDISHPDFLNFDTEKIGAPENIAELHSTQNPNEVARLYDEKVRELKEPTSSVESAIAAYGPKTDAEKFAQTDDRNNITGGIRLNYFRKEGTDAGSNNHLDTQATEINNLYFNGVDKVSEQDITDFMKKYPGGTKSFYTAKGNPELREYADRYKSITSFELTNKRAAQLAAKYTDVEPSEIRDIEQKNEGKEVTDKIKQFISDHLDKPGLHDGPDEILKKLEQEFDRYLQDPDNKFNLFHDDFKGDELNEDDIKQIREAISEAKDEQLADNTNDQESENETGSDASGQEAEGSEGEPVDDIPFQRGGGTEIPRERADVIQKLMEKVFPNVETIFHPTVEDFAAAAKVNHINAEDLPNAFVDKNGKINFNPEAIHADTQIHEYGHILTQWAKENAPALFKRMIAFGRDAKDIQTELKGNGYKMTESRMAEEAFVTMLGRHGEGKLDEVIKNSGTRGTISKFINDLWTKFQRYLIEKTGFDISKFKNIKDMPINEFLDTINSKYLLSENKIADIGTKEYSQIDEQKSNKPVRMADETMADYFKRVIEWTREQKTGQKGIDFTGEADKPEERPGYNFSETSIKNRVVKEERRARFLDEVESVNKRDFGQVWEAGKKMVDDGTKVMRGEGGFVEGLIKNPRPLMPEETAALTYDRMRLYNQHRAIMDNINDAMETNNAGAETEHRAALSAIEYEINQNDIAAKQVGYEQGAGLAARKMMAAQDYTLANQVQLATIANNGKELPSDVRMKMESLDKQLREAQKKLDDYEANEKARAAVTSLARLRKEVENEKRLETKQKRTKTAEQIDKSIAERKQAIYDKLFKNKSATSSPIPYADRLIEITPDLALLAKDYIRKGINTVEGLVDQLHDDLKDHLEGLTKRDLRDALSGYGKNSKPSKDTIDKQLRELKSQARLTSALEDAQRGERPLKSGYTHDMPSEAVRELQKKVHDAMRENGIEVEHKKISDEDAWKSALESVKTRLKNEIQDLNKQLETGVKPDKKASVILDQEATDLKAERDRLKAAIDEVEGNKELTDEQRVELLMKSTQKSIDEYQERIDNILNPKPEADKPKKTSIEDLVNKTPELKALRDRLSELKDIHDNLKDEAKPKLTPEEVALYAFKKRMASKIAELQDRIDRGDYAPAPEKPKVILDDHAKYLQTEVNKLQRKFDENREKIRLANRTTLEKRLDWISKYRRFILLSNVTTIAKLAAAGATRVVTSPLEEVAGYGLSFVPGLDKVSKMAPREGAGLSIEAEARSLAEVLSKRTLSEMYRTVKEGKSQLDERVDDKDRTYKENSAFELPGRIHAALKTVPKQIEYYRSLTKRIAWALRNGYDITSPDVQTSIQMDAFKEQYPTLFTGKSVAMSELEKAAFNDGKRAIFMQDNFLSDNWQAMIKRWETQGRKGEVAAMIAHVFLPIIKIPTNFVAETSSYAFGGVKAVLALSKGIEKLTPEDADYVMRALKKQSVGAGFFALGYFLPNAVGGFYQQGEKRKKDGPQADDLLIFGEPVPHWLMHAPVFEVMQMGATVRRIHEEYKKNKNVGAVEEGLIDLYATGKGLIGQVPLFGEPADIARGGENWESMKTFAANFVLGIVAPYDVQRVAKWMDEDSHGKPVQRKEKGFIQHIKGGVPVLREELKKK